VEQWCSGVYVMARERRGGSRGGRITRSDQPGLPDSPCQSFVKRFVKESGGRWGRRLPLAGGSRLAPPRIPDGECFPETGWPDRSDGR
jgi:hypothetical protein